MTLRIHLDRMAAVGRVLILSIALSPILLPDASWGASWTWNRTIHVDFDNGDDSRDGLSRATARRTPPPPERIRPGDRILFKGGVIVPRGLELAASGEADAPVIYDGNSEGEWGDGPAILDGSRALGPWTRAGSTAGGLPIWRTSAPKWLQHIEPLEMRLFQSGMLGRVASSADVEDNWADVDFDLYFQVPRAQATETSITYPELLGRLSDDWDGAALRIHHGNNHLKMFPVMGVDRDAGRIRHRRAPLIRRGDPKFAVVNHPDVLDAPGEILVRPDRILYVPFDGADPNAVAVRVPVVTRGFYNDEADHVVVRGFRLTMHRNWALRSGNPRKSWRGRGMVFEDNEVVDGGGIMIARQDEAVVRRNKVIQPLSRQPIFSYASDRLRLEHNEVRSGGTGITLYGTTNSLVLGNDTRRPRGVHGNALTVYEGSHNTWILGNTVVSGVAGTAITLRESDGLLVAFNEVVASRWAIVQWAQTSGGDRIDLINNTLIGTIRLQPETARRTRIRNNIIGKFEMSGGVDDFPVRDFNLYGWPPKSHASVTSEMFRAGELHVPMHEVLVAARRLDMRPTPEGREIVAKGAPVDILGVDRVSHVGARQPDGTRVDLSGAGLPPPAPAPRSTP